MQYDKHIWFNPAYLIHCGIEAQKHAVAKGRPLSSDVRKAINESRATAIWALGNNRVLNMEQLVQMAAPNEQTPDTRVMYPTKGPLPNKDMPWGEFWDVEVVTYEEHSKEPIDDFLKRTKLAATRSYQTGTIILCYIDKFIEDGKLWSDIHKDLKDVKSDLQVFLLGKTHPDKPIYAMARVYPTFDALVQIDVIEEAKRKYANPKGTQIINFPGDEIKIKLPERGYNPFII